MAIASISASDPAAAAAAAGLRLEDLLRVLLTELTHQDPFKPVDNKDFMAQIAQFASLDASQRLNDNIGQLVTLQAISQTVGLIGRTVSAVVDDGTTINGTVTALSLKDGVPRMTIHTASGQDHVDVLIGHLQTVR